MTLKVPKKDFSDKILAIFGKKRAVFIPKEGLSEKYGIYECKKESFFKALFRKKNEKPPIGWEYLD